MSMHLHFIRPWWFLTLLLLLPAFYLLWNKKIRSSVWEAVCDPHLLPYVLAHQKKAKSYKSLMALFFALLCIIFSAAGPSWQKLPVPVYELVHPCVFILDLGEEMMRQDLQPSRLTRAAFILSDLLDAKGLGQFALVVYTGEPFVVSPLTDDGKTIAALLSTLKPEIMPVDGNRLDLALKEGAKLIKQAGYDEGQLLVLTAAAPSSEAIDEAAALSLDGISTSLVALRKQPLPAPFQALVSAGTGQLLSYDLHQAAFRSWARQGVSGTAFERSADKEIARWQDEGRWFLVPALFFFLPLLRRGSMQGLFQ